MKSRFFRSSLFLAGLVFYSSPFSSATAASPSWFGSGNPNSGGNWDVSGNWSTGLVPLVNDDVTLGDVTSSVRTVFFNAPGITLSSLVFEQTTSGAAGSPIKNLLSLPTGTTLTVSDAMMLGTTAANATVGITVVGPSSAASTTPSLAASGGVTIGVGGIFTTQFGTPSSGNPPNFRAMNGSLTLSGGLIDILAPSGGGQTVDLGSVSGPNGTFAGSDLFTLTSGTVRLHNGSGGGGARLQFNGDLNWTGGTLQFFADQAGGTGAQSVILHGLTNTIGAGAVFQNISNNGATTATGAPALTMTIAATTLSGAQTVTQTLTSAVALGDMQLREFDTQTTSVYTHVVSSSAPGNNIGKVSINTSGATNIFKLGSDLKSSNTTSTFITAAITSTPTQATYGIDLNGKTFDGTLSSAGWQPNDAGNTTATKWQIISSASNGTFKAQFFQLALSGSPNSSDSLTVGSNVVLEATGGGGSASVLSVAGGATYSFAADSVFRYSGTATAGNSATVTSAVAIGAMDVQNGCLKIAQAAFSTQGGVVIRNSGTLDLNGSAGATLSLAANQNFTMSNGTLLLSVGDSTVLDHIVGGGTGVFSLSNGTLVLSLGSGFGYDQTYSLFSGFADGTISNLAITGYDSAHYMAILGTDGALSFAAIPESSTMLAMLLGIGVFIASRESIGLKRRSL